MKHREEETLSARSNAAMWSLLFQVTLALLSLAGRLVEPSEAMKLGFQQASELDEFPRNTSTTLHNVIKPRILTGLNKTGAQASERYSNDYQDNLPLPVSIEVKEGSSLVAEPGRQWRVIFEVTSNLLYATRFTFTAEDQSQTPIYTYPSRAEISAGNTVQCQITLQSNSRAIGSNPFIITFYVTWSENYRSTGERKKVYLYSGTQGSDNYSPDIWYDYDGDCSGSTPRNCEAKNWKATISAQDGSGLLSIQSDPVGLSLQNEFIVGTKDTVKGYYSSTCCFTKVDITAEDLLGNIRITHIDIEKRWLSAGDIAAIVLASILLVIIIAFIIWIIVYCCRKRKSTTLKVYSSHSRRGEE